MTQTPSLPVVGRLTADEALEADGTKIYAPRLRFQLRSGFVLICISLFGLFPLKGILDWLSGGPVPNAKTFFALVFLLILPICVFVILILNALRGLPRLTITPQGVTLKTSVGTKWANWDSVDSFAIKAVQAGRFSKPIQVASARVVGPNTNKLSRRAKVFSVPDHFQAPIGTILEDLNAARSQTVGVTQTFPTIEPSEAPVGLAGFKLPWLTFALLAVLVVIFILENVFAITPSVQSNPTIATLFALGALSSKAILSGGQWHRLFTAPLLHASIDHIVGNGVALLMGGWLLERFVGRLWFFALFVIGALGGSLMSLAVGSSNLISVGASGALMGLFAALCVSSFRLASGNPARVRMQVSSARILVPSLLPLFSTSSVHIDYGAHFGGAISGAVVAALLLKFWPETERIPQLRKVAAAASIIGAILFVASACIVIANYPTYRAAAAQPLPAIIPHQNPFPFAQPNPVPQPDSSKLETQSNVVLDHGPGRVACDLQWSSGSKKSADSYPDFLRNCMKK
jgi:membrane associated rhomboid family serine protease